MPTFNAPDITCGDKHCRPCQLGKTSAYGNHLYCSLFPTVELVFRDATKGTERCQECLDWEAKQEEEK